MYLSIKNLKYKKKNKKKSKKFDSIKIESFFIKTIKESINYELNLSANVKVFSIFHVFLLKSIDSNTFIQNIFHYEIQKDDEYEIEKNLNNQNQKYFIKWKNYLSKITHENISTISRIARENFEIIIKKRKRCEKSFVEIVEKHDLFRNHVDQRINFLVDDTMFRFFQFFDVSQFFIHYNTLFFFHIINLTK